MHGRVWYEPRKSSGSRFLFSFPLVAASAKIEPRRYKPPVDQDGLKTDNAHRDRVNTLSPILIVEDNAFVAAEMILLKR